MMKNKICLMVLTSVLMVSLTSCSSTSPVNKEYQKRSAEASDQQLDREVEKLKKTP